MQMASLTIEKNNASVRHNVLKKLIHTHEFSSQESVVTAMINKGFDVTQSSISRDFRELGIIKLAGRYRLSSNMTGSFESAIKQLIKGVDSAGDNLIIVITSAGGAAAVAEAIDLEELDGVAGTVAGDNTIFVATHDKKAQARVIKRIKEL